MYYFILKCFILLSEYLKFQVYMFFVYQVHTTFKIQVQVEENKCTCIFPTHVLPSFHIYILSQYRGFRSIKTVSATYRSTDLQSDQAENLLTCVVLLSIR